MTQIHASTSLYGLGTVKKADRFVVVAVKFVVRLKGKWYECIGTLDWWTYNIYSVYWIHHE
jgi:hypothetical protein